MLSVKQATCLQHPNRIYYWFYLFDIRHMLLGIAYVLCVYLWPQFVFVISFESKEDVFYLFVSLSPTNSMYSHQSSLKEEQEKCEYLINICRRNLS